MKKIVGKLGVFLAAAALFIGVACESQAATTVRTNVPTQTVNVNNHNAELYTVQIQVHGNPPYSNGSIYFNYIYSPEIMLTSEVIAKLKEILQSPFHELVPSVAQEGAVALFEYTASGSIDGHTVSDNLNANSADWSNIASFIKNKDIIPGRTAQLILKDGQEPLPELDDEITGSNDSDYVQVITGSSTVPVYEIVDGELVIVDNDNVNVENIHITSLSAKKVVSPLVLDMTGKGILEASNGNYLPHEGFDFEGCRYVDFFGDGFEVALEWVGPNDGLLVAPKADGTVDMSCLFGTAEGYDSGYEKLSLYADKEGIVKGDALKKLAVWQDANRNAIADKGEVKSCSELGITSMDVKNNKFVSSFVMNGKTYKMWDWWPNAMELRTIATK